MVQSCTKLFFYRIFLEGKTFLEIIKFNTNSKTKMKLVVHKQVLYFAVESIVKIRELFSLFVCSLKYGINGFVLI